MDVMDIGSSWDVDLFSNLVSTQWSRRRSSFYIIVYTTFGQL